MAGYSTPAWANESAPAISAAALLAMGQAVEIAQHPYGVCSTAAATAAKTVTVDFSGTLALFTGLTVRVKFANANTYNGPTTLNVNNTGAIPIVAFGASDTLGWKAGAVMDFTYDGTNWVYNGYDGFLRMAATSYTGTGTYGQNDPCSMTFDFSPMLMIVCRPADGLLPYAIAGAAWQDSFLWVKNQTQTFVNGTTASATVIFSQNGNTISWYGLGSAAVQLNANGVAYNVFAIGV